MSNDKRHTDAFVREVTEGTRRYIEELAQEIRDLRQAVSALEADKRALERALAERSAAIDQHGRDLEARFAEVQAQNAGLANLYVASFRLHETLERRAVIDTIQEIVINIIGSEELAIFEPTADGKALAMIGSFGVPPGKLERVPMGGGTIGRAAVEGELWVRQDEPLAGDEAHLSACVPLRLDGKTIGVIAVFRLLAHKPRLTRFDHELLELLATHAATALYSSGLQARLSELTRRA